MCEWLPSVSRSCLAVVLRWTLECLWHWFDVIHDVILDVIHHVNSQRDSPREFSA